MLLKFRHLLLHLGKFLRVFRCILAKFPHVFLCICESLFQIAILAQKRLNPLLRFLHPFQLSERLIPFLHQRCDLLICLGEFCVGLIPLLFRRNASLFSGGNGIFQAGDLCTQLLLLFGTTVSRRLERF